MGESLLMVLIVRRADNAVESSTADRELVTSSQIYFNLIVTFLLMSSMERPFATVKHLQEKIV